MQLPSILRPGTLTHLLLGALAGCLATVVIGFAWGGWTLESTAKRFFRSAVSVRLTVVSISASFKHN